VEPASGSTDRPLCFDGDSGAVWVDEHDCVVGLLVSGPVGVGLGYAIPMTAIFESQP